MRDDPTSAVLTALAALKEGQQQFVEALGRLRSELISRMDRVDSAITAIRDDITVTMRLADRAQEAADQTLRGTQRPWRSGHRYDAPNPGPTSRSSPPQGGRATHRIGADGFARIFVDDALGGLSRRRMALMRPTCARSGRRTHS